MLYALYDLLNRLLVNHSVDFSECFFISSAYNVYPFVSYNVSIGGAPQAVFGALVVVGF